MQVQQLYICSYFLLVKPVSCRYKYFIYIRIVYKLSHLDASTMLIIFLFELILALAMLVTCLNGQETSGGQSNHDDLVFNKLVLRVVDIECRLKQVRDKCVSVDISSEKGIYKY
jgi:hypothetical protein